MKKALIKIAAIIGLSIVINQLHAAGELHIYNWGDYTSSKLIKKFEKTYNIKVSLTEYDSNDTALAKLKVGGHGFDIVVPSGSYVPIFIKEGLLLKSMPNKLANFKYVDPRWVNVNFDFRRNYTVPWLWGTVGLTVNTKIYKGDINTSALFLDPPAELRGKINVLPEMLDVMELAVSYLGGKQCSSDLKLMKKVRDKLLKAKKHWLSMTYGTLDQYAQGDMAAGINWNGSSFRARKLNPALAYGYPREGYPIWMDNVAITAAAKNVKNAKLFMNFIMYPKNAALISTFARYSNGIVGSKKYMPKDMANAPEIKIPEKFQDAAYFAKPCPPDVHALYSKIWKEIQQ